MKTTTVAIPEDFRLNSARFESGTPIPVYDDGSGTLYIHRDSLGISGIVRADSWEDAYSICEDEFFPEASETIEEIRAEYNKTCEHVKIISDTLGTNRPATPADYPLNETGCTFVRWDTVETPAPEGEDVWPENELFCESFGFRPNGPRTGDEHGHGIYAKDLNGDSPEELTEELRAALGIVLELAPW